MTYQKRNRFVEQAESLYTDALFIMYTGQNENDRTRAKQICEELEDGLSSKELDWCAMKAAYRAQLWNDHVFGPDGWS